MAPSRAADHPGHISRPVSRVSRPVRRIARSRPVRRISRPVRRISRPVRRSRGQPWGDRLSNLHSYVDLQ